MAKPNSKFDELARDAAERIEAARAAGHQLTFLPDEPGPQDSERAKRGKGKATSQLRDWCAAKGLRMPEDVLVEMAGMASTEDAFVTAMARAEQVLAWAEAGATGYKGSPAAPSMAQRVAMFQMVYTAQLRAAEALLPYGLGKVTPDVAVTPPVQVFVAPGGAAQVQQGPETARDVTPKAPRLAPPPLPHEIQQKQGVAKTVQGASDGADRTEGASR
jgi:hypothetical protein